jgi:L-lactate dehydrogenase
MSDETRKIAIIGAGAVGATVAYACLIRGVGKHLVLHDIDSKKVHAQTLDLNHGLLFVPSATVEGSDDIAICKDARVVVITAGAKQKPGMTRMDLAESNVRMLRALMPPLLAQAPEAIYLLVTNPVDVITYVALKLSGLARERVFGSGTVLDSARFRYLIGQRLKVAVQNVHAFIAGEHGDSEIPLWSSASIANIPLHEWAVMHHGKLSVPDRVNIFESVRTAAYQIVEGKGATNFAIGLATGRILEAILNDENRILSVSSLLEKYRGISDVCLSVPTIINRSGVEMPLPVPMNAAEESGLRNSAEKIREAIQKLGF